MPKKTPDADSFESMLRRTIEDCARVEKEFLETIEERSLKYALEWSAGGAYAAAAKKSLAEDVLDEYIRQRNAPFLYWYAREQILRLGDVDDHLNSSFHSFGDINHTLRFWVWLVKEFYDLGLVPRPPVPMEKPEGEL